MPDGPRYEEDFYAWTQYQAKVLRTLRTRDNRFDREHVAEEIEDLGKSERDAVESQITRVIEHFLKLAHSPTEIEMNYPQIDVKPLDTDSRYGIKAYKALKQAITEMDIYNHPGDVRLEERQLSELLGVSRTPIREAMTVLEHEGFVRSVPRRGIFVVRKTKQEILEMITVWAALESMAARLATQSAADYEIRSLRQIFESFKERKPEDHVSEYSEVNLNFHKQIIRMSGCQLLIDQSDDLFIHMRGIRKVTISQDNRAQRSIGDHMKIIAAIEERDADLGERLVREHTFGLADHVRKYGNFLT